ncbi:AP-3 complex subunit beta [Saitoella coloradoensis]
MADLIAAQLSVRVNSALEQTAKDLRLDAAVAAASGSKQRITGLNDPRMRDVRKRLDSKMELERLEALKQLNGLMSRGQDVSEYFADVVKNVASPSLAIRKLVYAYLLRYAEAEPDLALLSINTIQKALGDKNQLVRGLALRVMAGIRVPVISGIVLLGIKKCATDPSPYVRKSAAICIPKCYSLEPSHLPQLIEYITTLLADRSTVVIGSAVSAFLQLCPERLDLIHPHYRRYCQMLVDMDEWSQVSLLRLLLMYARKCFLPPVDGSEEPTPVQKQKPKTTKDFYDEREEEGKREVQSESSRRRSTDPDLKLLLQLVAPLLLSRNSAVVMAATSIYFYLAPPSEMNRVVVPLLSLLRRSPDVQAVALSNISVISQQYASLFSRYHRHFIVWPSDPESVWKLKLEILALVATKDNINDILPELQRYCTSQDSDLSAAAVKAISMCAQAVPSMAEPCLRTLMRHLRSDDERLAAESVSAIRHLVQLSHEPNADVITTLAKSLAYVTDAKARENILWLVGQHSAVPGVLRVAPDVLRLCAKSFPEEDVSVKLQVLTLAAKLYSLYLAHDQGQHASEPKEITNEEQQTNEQNEEEPPSEAASPGGDNAGITLLYNYVTQLARYDLSYDLRDRSRYYQALLSSPLASAASQVLLASKPVPEQRYDTASRGRFVLGSVSLALNMETKDYVELPAWRESEDQVPPSSSRDVQVPVYEAPQSRTATPQSRTYSPAPSTQSSLKVAPLPKKVGISSLDDFYAESDEEEDEEEDEESEEETSSGEEEGSEDEEESGEEYTSDEETDEESGAEKELLPNEKHEQ